MFFKCERLLRTTMFGRLQAKKILDVKSFSYTLKEFTSIMDLFEKRFVIQVLMRIVKHIG